MKNSLSVKWVLAIILLALFNLNGKRLDNSTYSTKDLLTLVVIAEEKESLVLADIIRHKTKQPTLIYKKDFAVFIGAHNKAIKIQMKDVAAFVRFAHPRYILALGSPIKLPKTFVDTLKANLKKYHFPTQNWGELALQLDNFFSNKNISVAFLDRFSTQ